MNAYKVQEKMTSLETLLKKVTIHSQRRDSTKKKNFSLNWQFGMGKSTNALNAKSFETPHNFIEGRGVFMTPIEEQKIPKWKKNLWYAAKELLLEIDPTYAENDDYCVNFSNMTDSKNHFVKKHVDNCDITYQYGLALGDFTGGELTLEDSKENCQTINYHRKVVKMDGRLPHQVEPFEGDRYCVIFYKLYDRTKSQKDPIFEPAIEMKFLAVSN
jgi:hypothetical protein